MAKTISLYFSAGLAGLVVNVSETKFKKGEWSVTREGVRVVATDTGFGICEMVMTEEVDKHNAALIAAAPDELIIAVFIKLKLTKKN